MRIDNKKRIVYIEDDPDLIELVALILRQKGFDVIGVTEGINAFEIVRANPPDIILLDLMIPDLSGWDIFKQLSKNDLTKNIPVIVITAKCQPIDRVLGLHVIKVAAYVCKPFTPSELLNGIDQVLLTA